MKRNKLILSLSGLLLLTLIIASFSVNVQGANTLNYTFEKDVLYSESNPLFDESFNVRNQSIYTKIYNATYTFYNESGLTSDSISFINIDNSGESTCITIINNSDEHDLVLDLHDYSNGNKIDFKHYFEAQVSGTIEYWFKGSDLSKGTEFLLYSDITKCIQFSIIDEYIKYYDAGWHSIKLLYDNLWYHIKIDFECSLDGYKGLAADKFYVSINGLRYGPYNLRNPVDNLDIINFLTNQGDVNYHYFYDAFGFYWDPYYNIRDNVVPIINITNIIEPDRYEFYYKGEFDHFDNGDDNPNGWTDVETAGDDVNCLYESIVEILCDSGETNGLKKNDFSISSIDKLNVSFGFTVKDMSPVLTTRIDMKIYSYDSTTIAQIYIDEDGEIGYHNGLTYVVLDNGLTVEGVYYEINFYLDYRGSLCVMYYLADGIFVNKFIFPFKTLNKEGLDEIWFTGVSDTDGLQIWLDYIGVYINGSSITTVFGFVGVEIPYWIFDSYNLVYIDIEGDNIITYLESNASIGAPGFSPETLISLENYTKLVMVNLFDFLYDSYWGYTYINEGFLSFLFYNTIKINKISIEGVKLIEGINKYSLEYTHAGINPNNNYFRVDSNNRLQFTLTVTDDNLEFIQATFDIDDVPSENRSISFASDINGESKGFLSLDYTDDTINLIEFPYYQTTTKVILPQTKTIESFTILITDNDLDDSDRCSGYITGIRLLYNPDIEITILTIELLGIIVPLLILLIPSIIMGKKFGITGVIITFILMSLICVISNLIPVWLFFIIAFGSITFLLMKREGVI